MVSAGRPRVRFVKTVHVPSCPGCEAIQSFTAVAQEVNLIVAQCELHSENLRFLKIVHKNTKGINYDVPSRANVKDARPSTITWH